ncbi:MAG: polysaccharide biosynthesis tyrosine autokinase [Breznakibacter sp.]
MSDLDSQLSNKDFDFKKFFTRFLHYWYIVPVFFLLSLFGAIYSLKTTTPMYRVGTQILISGSEGRQTSSMGAVDENALQGFKLGLHSGLENQLVLLTSYKQIEKTLKQLDFGVSYYEDGFFQSNEIYKASPFKVILDTTNLKIRDLEFRLKFVSRDEFELKLSGGWTYDQKHKFFEPIKTDFFSLTVVPVEENTARVPYYEREYRFKVNTMHSLVMQYKSKIMFDRVKSGSSIIEVSIVENNVAKGIDFLNRLAQTSMNYTLDKKNQIAVNTINFIEKELTGISDSLSAAKKVLQDFRSQNEVMDVSMQGQMIIKQSQDLENQRASIMLKLDYYNYLIEYLQSNRDVQEMMAPSAMGVEDGVLTKLIADLSLQNAEKSRMQFNSKIANPNITRIDYQIQTLKSSILENTRSLVETTNLTLRDLDKRLMELSGQIRRLPKTEQMLVGINRKFRLSDEMYTFLMEKRSEAQLAKAANLPDNEIVEEAMYRQQVAPDTTRSFLIVMVVGIFLPLVVIFFIVYLNDKVQDEQDLEALTKHPVSGQIPHEKNAMSAAKYLSEHPKSILAESFRGLRTSLGYFANHSESRVYLVTSTIPGEGKSFCATNLATAYAQLGKKTLLMGFDLRRPSLGASFGIDDKSEGITNFYISDKKDVLKTVPSGIGNLDILFSGPLPPNPAELIAGEGTRDLFDLMKQKYEIIVVDTPPLGLVSDAHLLTSYSDVSIMVVRHNFTPKPVLKQVLQDSKVQKINNLTFIMNGLPSKKGNYSYVYGYGTDYYTAN